MTGNDTDVFDMFAQIYSATAQEEMSLQQYLLSCRDNPMMYATAAERMVDAIGEPTLIDTSRDERLGRIFANRTIKIYPEFSDFYGMEQTIERIVGYFRYAAQGLEERKQILYLLGPVGGGKSSLAERLKKLMEQRPIYTLKAGGQMSPIFESPLGLFDRDRMADLLEDKYGISRRRLNGLISPWAAKRLDEFKGDISKFSVVRLMPSRLRQIGIAKTEPGDENNQDVSALVGKVDIRQLENFSQADPDAYSHSGGLNRTTQGMLEFVEMFKAPIKVLHPLLTATQEGSYNGTENFGSFPYQGIVLAHSNESEWQQFKNNKNNEAFLDRILVVKVPYCLRTTEERKIYEKLLRESDLAGSTCAPEVLEILSRFTISTRLTPHENSPLYTKMRVYDGENLKDVDPKAKSVEEYRACRRRRRGHDRREHALCLQGAVGDLQLRHQGGRRRSGAPDVCAGAGDPARAVPQGSRKRPISISSRRSLPRAMPSSSATRSRRRIWNPTASMARTSSTATSPMPMPGSRTRTTRIPTPARC